MCLFHRFRWRACTNYVLVTLHRRYNTPNALARQQISTFHPQLTCYSRPGVWTKIRAFSIRQKTQSFRIPHAYIFPYAHQSRVNAVQTSTNKIVEKKKHTSMIGPFGNARLFTLYNSFVLHNSVLYLVVCVWGHFHLMNLYDKQKSMWYGECERNKLICPERHIHTHRKQKKTANKMEFAALWITFIVVVYIRARSLAEDLFSLPIYVYKAFM